MSAECLLSVIVTAHDRREYISDALGSVVSQNPGVGDFDFVALSNLERSTAVFVNSPLNLRWIHDPSPTVGETIVRAAEMAWGEVLVFLDDDDVFEPGKLSRVQAAFRDRPEILYYHNCFSQFSGRCPDLGGGRSSEPSNSLKSPPRGAQHVFGDGDTARLLGFLARSNREQNMSSTAIRKDVILRNRHLVRKIEGLQDTFLLFCALRGGGSVLFDDSKLTRVRRHSRNASRTQADVEKRVRAWGIVANLIETGFPPPIATQYYSIRHSRATIFERALGAPFSDKEVISALGTVLRSASLSGARKTGYYSILGCLALGSSSATAILRPLLTR